MPDHVIIPIIEEPGDFLQVVPHQPNRMMVTTGAIGAAVAGLQVLPGHIRNAVIAYIGENTARLSRQAVRRIVGGVVDAYKSYRDRPAPAVVWKEKTLDRPNKRPGSQLDRPTKRPRPDVQGPVPKPTSMEDDGWIFARIISAVGAKSPMQSIGGTVVKSDKRIVDAVKHVTAESRFEKFPTGSDRNAHATDYLHIGCFNPLFIMNAQYAINASSANEERSSSFTNRATDGTTPTTRQWNTPKPLAQFENQGIYTQYRVLKASAVIKFTNTSATDSKVIWFKTFYPGDLRVCPAAVADVVNDFPASSSSLLTLEADNTVTAGGESRESLSALNSTGGMHRVELGPDSSNGLSNYQSIYIEIETDKVMRESALGISLASATTLPDAGSDAVGLQQGIMLLKQTAPVPLTCEQPTVHFWAANYSDGSTSTNSGAVTAVTADTDTSGGHDLWVEGIATYSVNLFGTTPQAIVDLDDDVL